MKKINKTILFIQYFNAETSVRGNTDVGITLYWIVLYYAMFLHFLLVACKLSFILNYFDKLGQIVLLLLPILVIISYCTYLLWKTNLDLQQSRDFDPLKLSKIKLRLMAWSYMLIPILYLCLIIYIKKSESH